MSDNDIVTYEELLERDGRFIYTSVGVSMMPLIRQGRDLIYIKARMKDEEGELLPLDAMDVVLFKRGERYVLHRVMEVLSDGSYIICGDNQFYGEHVCDSQIIGVLDKVIRDGEVVDPCDPEYLSGLEMDLSVRKKKILRRTFLRRALGKCKRTVKNIIPNFMKNSE